jgi:hypothetical protein
VLPGRCRLPCCGTRGASSVPRLDVPVQSVDVDAARAAPVGPFDDESCAALSLCLTQRVVDLFCGARAWLILSGRSGSLFSRCAVRDV